MKIKRRNSECPYYYVDTVTGKSSILISRRQWEYIKRISRFHGKDWIHPIPKMNSSGTWSFVLLCPMCKRKRLWFRSAGSGTFDIACSCGCSASRINKAIGLPGNWHLGNIELSRFDGPAFPKKPFTEEQLHEQCGLLASQCGYISPHATPEHNRLCKRLMNFRKSLKKNDAKTTTQQGKRRTIKIKRRGR